MMKQIKLFKDIMPKEFGSDLNLGKRKEQRPISIKTPMHLILKSDNYNDFKKIEHKICKLIHVFGERFVVQIYGIAVHHNHIHLLILVSTRQSYNSFIRALNGSMVKKLGLPKEVFNKAPYTRIVGWGRDFQNVQDYITRNRFEAEGKTHYFEALHGQQALKPKLSASSPTISLRNVPKNDTPLLRKC